jgi:rRNA maturation protein Nop10
MTYWLNFTLMISNECPVCGGNLFKIDAIFDDDFELTFYMLKAECSQCGEPLTAPTPCDKVKERHLRLVRNNDG